jgi:hypothetical protein
MVQFFSDNFASFLNIGLLIGWLATTISWYMDGVRQQKQALIDVRRNTYGRLVAALKERGNYPGFDFNRPLDEVVEKKKEEERRVWSEKNKVVKGIASEALLLASDNDLIQKLEVISADFSLLDHAVKCEDLLSLLKKDLK